MAEKSERGTSGIKCKSCPYWCDECKRLNYGRPSQAHLPTESLCWCCKNAVPDKEGTRGCSWSLNKQPVKGWKVEASSEYHMADGRVAISYKVSRCPKFERS